MKRACGFFLGFAVLSTVFACAPGARRSENVDALDDALIAQDFDETVRQLTALPYLPWGYTPDGCYARALYYSMLLATKGVPTNHLYVVARPGTSLGGIWRWHVAPLVTKDGDPNHVYVLDPVYDQTKAMTNLEWLAHQNHTDPAATTYPRLHVWPGTSYLKPDNFVEPLVNPAEPVAADYKEPVFEAMPSFAMSDVTAACSTMHRYINIEPNTTAEQKTAKHQALGRETKNILAGLVAKNKVTGTPTLPASCTLDTPTGTDAGAPAPTVDGGVPTPGDAGAPTTTDSQPFVDPTRL